MKEGKARISEATFYRWKERHDGLMPSEARKLKHIEEENARLRYPFTNIPITLHHCVYHHPSCLHPPHIF